MATSTRVHLLTQNFVVHNHKYSVLCTGATFLRLSHYEHNDYTYQLADQNGLCVWSEIPLIDNITQSPAFYTNTLQQLREMIRQRYNHPSIIFWSVYNEVTLDPGPSPTNLISQEVQLVSQEDPNRPSTAAANTIFQRSSVPFARFSGEIRSSFP